jgi:hypothetical protein
MSKSTLRMCAAAVIASAPSVVGCYSPGLYQPPRTLAPKSASYLVAVEPAVVVKNEGAAVKLGIGPLGSVVFHWRFGVAKGVELSGSLGLLSLGQASVAFKGEVARSDVADLALIARLGVAQVTQVRALAACAGTACEASSFDPSISAILGLNIADGATITLAPGAAVYFGDQTKGSFRMSMGLQIRTSTKFFIHPEVTYVYRPLGLTTDFGGFFAGVAFGARGQDGYPNAAEPKK